MLVKVAGREALRQLLAAHRGVVLQFSASWCGPCRVLHPTVEAAARRHPQLKFLSADVDEQPQLADDHSVSSIPATFLYLDGAERQRLTGSDPERFNAAVTALAKALQPSTPH